MIVYRFEDENGNGPFLTRKGEPNNNGLVATGAPSFKNNKYFSACTKVNELLKYFSPYVGLNLLITKFKIIAYKTEDVKQLKSHVIFNIETATKIGEI